MKAEKVDGPFGPHYVLEREHGFIVLPRKDFTKFYSQELLNILDREGKYSSPAQDVAQLDLDLNTDINE